MKWTFIVGVIVVVVVLVGLLLAWPAESPENEITVPSEPEFNNVSDGDGQFIQLAPEEGPETEETSDENDAAEEKEDDTVTEMQIEITDLGFEPSDVTIAVGTLVTFTNNGQGSHWPASDVHPTHRSYPGSDISKCKTDEADDLFDACRGLTTGETYSFTFNEIGDWQYHDHLLSTQGGTITVTEN